MPGRLGRLLGGLLLFGLGLTLMVRSGLGLSPWDVLHDGIARRTGLTIGWIVIAMSLVVLVLWVPLRERPGLGTVANALGVGLVVNGTLAMVPAAGGIGWRWLFLAAGTVLIGVGTGLYIGAGLGSGPRDGLMTGLARRGWSIRWARTVVEVSVLAAGIALGGTVGIGTLVFAVAIGPLAHFFIPRLTVHPAHARQAHATTPCAEPPPASAAPCSR
ncbi:MAG: hypothetical protein M3349_05005 [Actinomycetota bacterium]|nr:hypothetical protein [Actinomycetota bacterium]